MSSLTTIGFDADDTLWHNEKFFKFTEAQFVGLLGSHAEPETISSRLLAAERKNLKFYGFGIKGFTLSMIETAIDVTNGQVPGEVIGRILEHGREMLHHPVELLPHAAETVAALRPHYRILLITKGDLFDQERKLAQSGLGELFHGIEIVSDKTPETYARIFQRHGDGADRGLMAGNSMKSDVLPMLAAGGFGVHVPHDLAWELEQAEAPELHGRFHAIEHLGSLPPLVATLSDPPRDPR